MSLSSIYKEKMEAPKVHKAGASVLNVASLLCLMLLSRHWHCPPWSTFLMETASLLDYLCICHDSSLSFSFPEPHQLLQKGIQMAGKWGWNAHPLKPLMDGRWWKVKTNKKSATVSFLVIFLVCFSLSCRETSESQEHSWDRWLCRKQSVTSRKSYLNRLPVCSSVQKCPSKEHLACARFNVLATAMRICNKWLLLKLGPLTTLWWIWCSPLYLGLVVVLE